MIQNVLQSQKVEHFLEIIGVWVFVGWFFSWDFSGVFHVDFFPANLVIHTVLVFEDRREVLSVSKLKEQFEEAIRTKVIPYRNIYSMVGDTDCVYLDPYLT